MTIFALSSGGGRAGIAIVRISGRFAGRAVEALTDSPLPVARRATLAGFRNPVDGEVVDRGMLLWFPGPHSFTGEDVAELHVHGGPAVVSAILMVLADIDGLRPADPGDFTRRAFENGKYDLTQAEAIGDLVSAETAAQRRQAQRQLAGLLGEQYEGWRSGLVRCLAHIEAYIDFPEEEIPPDTEAQISGDIALIYAAIEDHLDDDGRGEKLRVGFHVAIIGAPNVGKSSLLNVLAGRDAAIVSETAGTTRDVIDVRLDLGGYLVIVSDTAGLRVGTDNVEAEGVRRAIAAAADADLKIAVFAIESLDAPDPETVSLVDEATVVVVNKMDAGLVPAGMKIGGYEILPVSAKSGENVGKLEARLVEEIGRRYASSMAPVITHLRHRRALQSCSEALKRAHSQICSGAFSELAAEDLRLAVRALGSVTGRVDVEDVLDVVFREFCIGK
ncbi:MAG: tRNA uridine-5-carboxymethylaminomethyl(34) synthesis GTPase MnmE [Proteobacteria bacterium]|nr:tRNA uridine-5-carboxymethylaminomethyl(34) synthesis GTPase MnmE [Pseudomonadota bacterium]